MTNKYMKGMKRRTISTAGLACSHPLGFPEMANCSHFPTIGGLMLVCLGKMGSDVFVRRFELTGEHDVVHQGLFR